VNALLPFLLPVPLLYCRLLPSFRLREKYGQHFPSLFFATAIKQFFSFPFFPLRASSFLLFVPLSYFFRFLAGHFFFPFFFSYHQRTSSAEEQFPLPLLLFPFSLLLSPLCTKRGGITLFPLFPLPPLTHQDSSLSWLFLFASGIVTETTAPFSLPFLRFSQDRRNSSLFFLPFPLLAFFFRTGLGNLQAFLLPLLSPRVLAGRSFPFFSLRHPPFGEEPACKMTFPFLFLHMVRPAKEIFSIPLPFLPRSSLT